MDMIIIRTSRFIRNIATLIMIAGGIAGYIPGMKAGVLLYCISLSISIVSIENIFLAAEEQLRGQNEQKPGGDVGSGNVPKVGP